MMSSIPLIYLTLTGVSVDVTGYLTNVAGYLDRYGLVHLAIIHASLMAFLIWTLLNILGGLK